MIAWTVIGLREDTGEVWVAHLEGKYRDEYDAMRIAAQGCDDDLVILGAIKGFAELLTPGDDNNKSVYAKDLL